MNGNDFFEEPLEQSRVKSRIVSKYFTGWARVMINWIGPNTTGKIGYFDLYAGTGLYADGSKSTPILILEEAIRTKAIGDKLVTLFNDKCIENCNQLKKAIETLPGYEELRYKPEFLQTEVDTDLVDFFAPKRLIPSILFLDPWGYKGLSLKLIDSVVKDWGCECIFFFNYLRVNAALNNDAFKESIDNIFGVDRARRMREELKQNPENQKPLSREKFILNELTEALCGNGDRYVLKFRFVSPSADRTSHYLIHVTKGFRGYEIMKNIMAAESVPNDSTIPTFEFTINPEPNLMLELENPIEELAQELKVRFSGRCVPFETVYKEHSPNTNYIPKNYRNALTLLEDHGKISVQTSSEKKRRKGTFGETVQITFQG